MKELLDCFAWHNDSRETAKSRKTNICASGSECMCRCHTYGAVGCTDCLDTKIKELKKK